jgi:TRAP-type C4-dicarboxylate transport system permease small subunit
VSVIKWLDKHLEESLLLIFLIMMVIVMGIQVIARYVFSASLSWSEELTRYLFVCSGFLSASYCIKHNLSIKITQLIELLPEKIMNLFKLISYMIQMAFFIYLTPFAVKFVASAIESGQRTAAIGLPMWIVESSTVLCCVLSIIRLLQEGVICVKLLKNGEAE